MFVGIVWKALDSLHSFHKELIKDGRLVADFTLRSSQHNALRNFLASGASKSCFILIMRVAWGKAEVSLQETTQQVSFNLEQFVHSAVVEVL